MKTPNEKFWSRVFKTTEKECWNWLGEVSCHGYGRFSPTGKKKDRIMAHRMMWIINHGPIPKGKEICHRCDNPTCCNPKHLFCGTHKQNMSDCKNKNRLNTPKGEHQGSSKLTAAQVTQIRFMYRPFVVSQKMIANLFGVSERCISLIIKRKNWKHITSTKANDSRKGA
jgi:hypothetical protein